MGLLGEIYSAGDSAKRKLKGLLSDPLGELGLFGTRAAEDIQNMNQLAAMAYPMLPSEKIRTDTPQGRERVVEQNRARNQLADLASNMGMAAATVWHGGRLVDAPTAEKQGILINGMPALSTSTSRRQAENYARHNIGNLYKIDTSGMKIYTPGTNPVLDASINANDWAKIKSAGFDGVNLPNKEIALFDYQGAKNKVKSVLSNASLDGKWRNEIKP